MDSLHLLTPITAPAARYPHQLLIPLPRFEQVHCQEVVREGEALHRFRTDLGGQLSNSRPWVGVQRTLWEDGAKSIQRNN